MFGFAPYWTINKLDNVDFNILTTIAYFDVPVLPDGSFDVASPGYSTFMSGKATEVFSKAHNHGTRVVVTLTQMDAYGIQSILDSDDAQDRLIRETVSLVKKRGIDGVNIDFEYIQDPGNSYRTKFTEFVAKMTESMHKNVEWSKVTVSVIASSQKSPKLYDIGEISKSADGIFMMAYDFAVLGSDTAMPTSPLYGHKEGKYWYDVASAVTDFLKVMPPEKLILGVPWYGYDYPVYSPTVGGDTYQGYYTYYWWRGRKYWQYNRPPSMVKTYEMASNEIQPSNPEIQEYKTGWDDYGKVGWKGYYLADGTWRMLFIEDVKSLGIKFDYAMAKNLGGVGMWALGFDDGRTEFWDLLRYKFGEKIADNRIVKKVIPYEED